MEKLHKKSSKSINKYNIIIVITLIFGILVFFSSLFLLDYLNEYIRVAVSFLLIMDSLIAVIYTFITYNRNSSEDIWWGHRLEIIILCILFVFWSIVIHFI